MADRLIDTGLYMLARIWVVCAALLAISAIKLAADIAAPVHGARIVLPIR